MMRCPTCDREWPRESHGVDPMTIPLGSYHTRCGCGWPVTVEEFNERDMCRVCWRLVLIHGRKHAPIDAGDSKPLHFRRIG